MFIEFNKQENDKGSSNCQSNLESLGLHENHDLSSKKKSKFFTLTHHDNKADLSFLENNNKLDNDTGGKIFIFLTLLRD